MKIAQVCPNYYPYIGGVEIAVEEISRRLVKRGIETTVLTTDPSGLLQREEIIDQVVVRRFKSWAPGEAFYFSSDLKNHLRKNSKEYDIVHAHSYAAFPALYAAQAKNEARLVFNPHYHGTGHTFLRRILHLPYRLLGRRIFKAADKLVFVSQYEKNLASRHFKIDVEKSTVIPNGLNLEEFMNLKHSKKQSTNNGTRELLFVGRLEEYKGVQYIMKALPQLEQGTSLSVVGKGPFKKNLIQLATKLNIADRLTFYQDLPREELLQKYADADVFILLSKREAYGISVAEALCAKTPCIVANTSALTEWIDGENCFGIDYPINITRLVGLIDSVCGRRANRSGILDWDEVAERLVAVYKSIND